MNNKDRISIFQIFYDDLSKKYLDPFFIPFHNKENDDFFENRAIKNIYENNLKDIHINNYIGTTSWKFNQKTEMYGSEIYDHILYDIDNNSEKDIYIFPPLPNILINYDITLENSRYEYSGYIQYLNLFLNHKKNRKNVYKLCEKLQNENILPFNFLDGNWIYSLSNFWCAKKYIYEEFCRDILIPVIDWLISLPDDFVKKDYKHPSISNLLFPYTILLEGLFGAFVAHNNYSYSYICKSQVTARQYSKINIIGLKEESDTEIRMIDKINNDIIPFIKEEPIISLKEEPINTYETTTPAKPANIIAYTAITNNYDNVRNDILTFGDHELDKFVSPNMNAKIYKVLSHKYIKSDYSIWVDGNISIIADYDKIISELLGDSDIAVFTHPMRKCLYNEAEAAKKRIDNIYHTLIDEQLDKYKKENMPKNLALAECGIIIRKNNDIVREFNERWWCEICRYTNRDQISFPYIWWIMRGRISIKFIKGNLREHKYFKFNEREE